MKSYYYSLSGKLILLVLLIFTLSGYSQQIINFNSDGVDNICFIYKVKSDTNLAESKSFLNVAKNNYYDDNETYLVSKPIKINQKSENSVISLAYVLKGKRLDVFKPLFYISVSNDGINYQNAEIIDAELIIDSVIYGNLYFFNSQPKFVKFFVTYENKSEKSIIEEIRISIINTGVDNNKNSVVADSKNSAMPSFISRTEWACADGQNSPLWTPQYTNVSHLVVHHTAGSNNTSQNYAATVRSIWSQHTYTNSWGDIGYNFLIDAYGKIYEGRAGGNNVIGAHCGFNSATMGVSVMGTYSSVLPSDTALGSLISMLAWKCNDSKINPFDVLFHASSGKTINTICGHRDVKSTECPGNAFYTELEVVRSEVNKLLQASVSTKNNIKIYPTPIHETLTLDIEHINWKNFTVEITDIYGRLIKKEDIKGFEGGKIYLNLFDLKRGMYYLRMLSISDLLFSEKIIKN